MRTASAKQLPENILDFIGGTSTIALRNIGPRNGARVLLKLESENRPAA
jgi:cysteine synthase A